MAQATIQNPNGPSGRSLQPGDSIKSFRGVEYTFQGIERLPEPGRSGKVRVKDDEGNLLVFYDMVFPGLKLES